MTQKRHLWFTDLDLDWKHMVDVWENVYVCFLMPLVGKSPEKKNIFTNVATTQKNRPYLALLH